MAQKNAVIKIATPFMHAEAEGRVYIEKSSPDTEKHYSLESDLVGNGWRYIQNDFKTYLNNSRRNLQPDMSAEIIVSESIDNLVDLCMNYAEIDSQDARNALRNSAKRALLWDKEYGSFSYPAKEIPGSSLLIADSIDKAFRTEGAQKLSSKADNSLYRNYQRNLFTTEPSDKSRKMILQFAYLLKMSGEETNTYLTKWAFSDSIRWDNPWELAAAYEIECCPAREEDRADSFLEAVEARVQRNAAAPNAPENQKFLEFLRSKEQQEYDAWVNAYRKHCSRNQQEAFLCHWAWLLLIPGKKNPLKRLIPATSAKELGAELSGSYRRLKEYVQTYVPLDHEAVIGEALPQKDYDLYQRIVQIMKNRQLRLAAAAYVYAHVSNTENEQELKLTYQGQSVTYTLPNRNLGFYGLPKYAAKLEYRQKLFRSDVISLGIALGLTTRGINQLLDIGGFYELYARDFFEYALIRALHELESSFCTDGFRLAAQSSTEIRCDDDLDKVRQKLRETFLLCLEENYSQLTNKTEIEKSEPNWIKYTIRTDDQAF